MVASSLARKPATGATQLLATKNFPMALSFMLNCLSINIRSTSFSEPKLVSKLIHTHPISDGNDISYIPKNKTITFFSSTKHLKQKSTKQKLTNAIITP